MKDFSPKLLNDRINTFVRDRGWEKVHTPTQLAIGLVTESAELLHLFRFKSEAEVRDLLIRERESVEDEIADVWYCLLRLCDMCEIDIESAVLTKLKKNEIKYPAISSSLT